MSPAHKNKRDIRGQQRSATNDRGAKVLLKSETLERRSAELACEGDHAGTAGVTWLASITHAYANAAVITPSRASLYTSFLDDGRIDPPHV